MVLRNGCSQASLQDSARQAGIRGFLQKPYSLQELARSVRSLLPLV